jgi:hypothetical protein
MHIDGESLEFKGAPPRDCETFGLCRKEQSGLCKTERRPYDELVAARVSEGSSVWAHDTWPSTALNA